MKLGDLRVIPAEIGGGFGGKTVIYLEPVAVALSRKSGLPVKLVMSREEVFRASGPTSGSSMTVKIGAKKRRHDRRRRRRLQVPGRRLPGLAGDRRAACARLRPTTSPNARAIGYDVVCNRPKVAAYRAPGSPIARFRGRKRDGRAGAEDRHGPAGTAAEERRQDRHARRFPAPKLAPRRLCRDA